MYPDTDQRAARVGTSLSAGRGQRLTCLHSPVSGLHPSRVHTLLSLQERAGPGTQTKPLQVSPVVHSLPSSQLTWPPKCEHSPVFGLQVSRVQLLESLACQSQLTAVVPAILRRSGTNSTDTDVIRCTRVAVIANKSVWYEDAFPVDTRICCTEVLIVTLLRKADRAFAINAYVICTRSRDLARRFVGYSRTSPI